TDHLAHEARLDQFVRVGVAVGGRVDDQRQVFGTAIAQRPDQHIGKARAAEPGNENGRAIGDTGERLGRTRGPLVDRHCGLRLPAHSALRPANLMTLPLLSVSSAMSFANDVVEPPIATQPRSSNFAFIAGSASAVLISRLSFSTMATGVSFGAPTPY